MAEHPEIDAAPPHGFPSALPRPAGEREALERAWARPRGWRIFSAVNNTQIGAFYIVTALLFFVLGGILALVMRVQLAVPDNDLLDAATYILRHCMSAPLGDKPDLQRTLRVCVLTALMCTIGAFSLSLGGHLLTGLSPRADGWSAAVGVIVAYQGFHCVLMMVLGGFLLARSWSGHLQPRARATLDNVGLLWQAAALQGILAEAVLSIVIALMP